MAGGQTQKPGSKAAPFHTRRHWCFLVEIFSYLFILKASSMTSRCNFSDRFGSDASLWHRFAVWDFIVIAVLVQTGLMILFDLFSFFVSSAFTVFSQQHQFFQYIFKNNSKKSVDLLDLTRVLWTVLTWPLPALSVSKLAFANGKKENLSYASWKSCFDRLLVRNAAGNIDLMF